MSYMLDEKGTLSLPEEARVWTIADLGIKGSGKTYGGADFAEELLIKGTPITVVDPLGIWWGLRVGVDHEGNSDPALAGLPIVIFGGRHADLPLPLTEVIKKKQRYQQLDEDKLKVLVRSILDSGISSIIDVSGLSNNLQRRIVAQFLFEVMRQYEAHGGRIRHFFIEEADQFAPQKMWGQDESMNSLGAMSKLVKQGGNFNLGCTMITQRPAVLNKDVLSQASCLFVFRILYKTDKEAIRDGWIASNADPKDKTILKWLDGLKDLGNGEGWIWHPEKPYEIFTQIKFRKRTTLHATREYFQQAGRTPVKLTDIGDYINKFQKVFTPTPLQTASVPPVRNLGNVIVENVQPPERYVPARIGDTSPQERHPEIEVTKDVVDFNVPRDQLIAVLNELEPRTCFGRLLVVLKQGTDNAGNRKWTLSSIHEALEQHGWPHSDQEIKEAIEQLLRTEHLEPVAAGSRGFDYKFKGANRVRFRERVRELPVPAVCIILGALLLAWYLHLPL